MHEKLKIEIQDNNDNNPNTNNNINNLETIKVINKDEPKNLKLNIKEGTIPLKNINFKIPINDKNYNIMNQSSTKKDYNQNENININNQNEAMNKDNQNENNNLNFQYQLMNENKNAYKYSYTKIHSHHPTPYPHSGLIKPGLDNRHHHHHPHRHSQHGNGMKRAKEYRKKNIDFIDNLNAQFKFNVEPLTEPTPTKVKINNNENDSKTMENKHINANQQENQEQQHQHHHHYHPYTYRFDYPNYQKNDLDDKKERKGKKDTFDLSDIKVVLETQTNKPLKKSVSFSIENDELRCPSNKPYHLKQRMENRQRINNKNYEILANTKELMLEKDLNEREIKFFCLRVMEQNAQQKHSEIIKQRKEKISNHSQHINNVRRRNVLDRSKWRCERSQKMNRRQLKVEQNRRKIISSKKALYAALVEKAKNVVIDLKKKEELMKLKRLENLNEKMDESEKRRQVLINTAKSKILDVSSSLYHKQKLEKWAAVEIQRWWRKKVFGPVLTPFIDLDITSDVANTLSFEKLHEKLHSSEAMEISRKLLFRIFKANQKPSTENEDQESNRDEISSTTGTIPTIKSSDTLSTATTNISNNSKKKTHAMIKHYSEEKMFLSAFMIYGHSKTVISSIGDVEKDLIEASEIMIKSFEKLVFSFNQPSFYKILQEFNEIWEDFSNKFKVWKKKDSEALLDILIQHWIEMEKLWFSVKDYEAANTWQSKIVIQQRNIKKKIETLAGRSGILKLIRKTHKSRESKFPGIIFKPNAMPSPYLFPLNKNGQTTINQNSVVNPENIPKENIETKNPNHSVSTNTIKPKQENDDKNDKENHDTDKKKEETKKEEDKDKKEDEVRDIDQTFVMNLLNEYNHRFTNFQLAHEIVLNPNFQFHYLNEENNDDNNEKASSNTTDNYNNIITKVTKIAQKAFFDMVQESFDSGNDTQFIPGIVKDIKDRLLYLTNKNKKTYNQINEVLDEKLIVQQIQHGTTNFDNIFKYVLDTMLQLCAPVRDPAIKKIYTMEKPVQKIKAVLNQLDNMKIDLANYNIMKFRPILKEFAVEYERKKFKEAIENNLIDLEYTEKWLSQSIIRLIKNQSNIKLTKELKKKKKESQTKYIDIYNDAFLSLLFKREILNNDKSFMESEKMKSGSASQSESDLSDNTIYNNKSNLSSSKNSSSTFNKTSNPGTEDGRYSPNKMNKKNNSGGGQPTIRNDEIVLPETLMFDFGRILEYQQNIRNIAIVSSITILCQSIIPYLHGKEFIIKNLYIELLDYIENNLPVQQTKKDENSNNNNNTGTTSSSNGINDNKSESTVDEGKKRNKMDKESKLSSIMADFAKYIITKIETVILDSIIEYNKVITHYVKLEPKILSANEKVLLKKMIVNTLVLNNNMYNIISRQIMSLLLHYLKTGEFKTETLDRFCLQYSKDKLQTIFSKIKLFTEYNRDVYSEHYDKIISKLLIINKFYPS